MQLVFVILATCLGSGPCPERCHEARNSSSCIGQLPLADGYSTGDEAGVIFRASEIDAASPPPLERIPGTPAPVVNACRASVVALARPLNPVHVDAVSAGKAVFGPDGILRAPIEIQIIYSEGGEQEIRQSRVECHVDQDGMVVALEDVAENPGDAVLEPAPDQLDDPTATGSIPRPYTAGGDVVEAFYRALGAGDGEAASQYVVPEKQMEGPLSAREISGYFGRLEHPLQAHRIVPAGANQFDVSYSYGISSRYCAGSARVMLTSRNSVTYIESIRASEDCS